MAAPIEWLGKNAPAPLWEKFLNDIFQRDKEMIRYFRRLLGYAITGSGVEHIFCILWGEGRNGKTTLMKILENIFGYLCTPIPSETLFTQKTSTPGSSPRADIMKFRGARIVWASESGKDRRFNVEIIKLLTGGDTLTARAPFGKQLIDFKPTHTLFFLTNHKPSVSANEYAFWERVHLIPFNLSYVDNPRNPHQRKKDPFLFEKLKEEAPGILAWLVKGYEKWNKHGLKPPSSVRKAIKVYREQEDTLGRFLNDCCTKGKNYNIKANLLYKAYQKWCKIEDMDQLSQTKFGINIKEHLNSKISNGVRYIGIKLNERYT